MYTYVCIYYISYTHISLISYTYQPIRIHTMLQWRPLYQKPVRMLTCAYKNDDYQNFIMRSLNQVVKTHHTDNVLWNQCQQCFITTIVLCEHSTQCEHISVLPALLLLLVQIERIVCIMLVCLINCAADWLG